ncbi:MAG: hypothetical protein MSH10_05420 [Pygmaiobacter massiliensis]|nr:hypothetical protein [Pygmaiobacter massiliensis]
MVKKWQILCLVMALAFCSGCSRPLPLEDRGVVKLIFAQPASAGYSFTILYLTAQGDAEQASSTPNLVTGTGESPGQALADAESKTAKKLFYAQNELLLFSSHTSRQMMQQVVDYFSQENYSRTNTAVYGCEPDILTEQEREWQELSEQLEKRPDDTDALVRRLYTFSDEKDYLLPLVEQNEQKEPLVQKALVLPVQGENYLLADRALRLCQVLTEHSGAVRCLSGEDVCWLEDMSVAFEVKQQGQRLVQQVTLTGTIYDYAGSLTPSQLQEQAECQLKQQAELLYKELGEKRHSSLLPFGWQFYAYNSHLAYQLQKGGKLFEEDAVTFQCKVQVG